MQPVAVQADHLQSDARTGNGSMNEGAAGKDGRPSCKPSMPQLPLTADVICMLHKQEQHGLKDLPAEKSEAEL